jgi:hypothetical protein
MLSHNGSNATRGYTRHGAQCAPHAQSLSASTQRALSERRATGSQTTPRLTSILPLCQPCCARRCRVFHRSFFSHSHIALSYRFAGFTPLQRQCSGYTLLRPTLALTRLAGLPLSERYCLGRCKVGLWFTPADSRATAPCFTSSVKTRRTHAPGSAVPCKEATYRDSSFSPPSVLTHLLPEERSPKLQRSHPRGALREQNQYS